MSSTNTGTQLILWPEAPYGIIYKATCTPNRKLYIGQTVQTLPKRRHGHKVSAFLSKAKFAFPSAIRKYGWESFSWEVIDTAVSKEDLDYKEKYWIQELRTLTSSGGYNLNDGGSNGKRSPETKALLSKIMMGRKLTEETKQKLRGKPMPDHVREAIRAGSLGRKQSQEEKDKRATSLRGLKHSEESRLHASEGAKKRYEDPEERRKISERGKGRVVSESTRQKLRDANLGKVRGPSGRVVSESTRQKLRDSRLGHVCSAETRARMSSSQKGRLHGPCSEETKQKLRDLNLGKVLSSETRAKMRLARLASVARKGVVL